MVHRISPFRIAKRRQVAARGALPPGHFVHIGIPQDRLQAFEAEFTGSVVVPGDPDYVRDRQESNPAFQSYPKLICYCVNENDVALALAFAQENALPFAIRSGGHSTAGYSVCDGLVIDMSRLCGIVIDEAARTVFVRPGTDFDQLNRALDPTGLHVPSGACGDVCVGGFVQGGGYGYTSRRFGMQCDSVLAFRVMLWNGGIVTADASRNADLLWALRGGTGGNFGVLLGVTYRLHDLAPVWAFAVSWPIARAAEVLHRLQSSFTRVGAPPELGYMMNVGFGPDGEPVALIQGMYCGTPAEGLAALQPLLDLGHDRIWSEVGPYGRMDEWLDSNPFPMPNPPAGVLEDKISGYIDRPLDVADWQNIVDWTLLQPKGSGSVMYTEPYGGAILRAPPEGTAFVHRQVDLNIVFDTFWMPTQDPKAGGRAAAERWLSFLGEKMKPYFSGRIYQNYPRGSYTDFRQAYFAESYPRLVAVKAKYDPGDVFRYAQSIGPADPDEGVGHAPGPDGAIVYDRAPR